MDNSLKQRIIGAVVLAALAVIFLPAILKEKTSNGSFVSKIPEKPQELEEYVVDTKKIDQLIAEKGQSSYATNAENKAQTSDPEANGLNPSPNTSLKNSEQADTTTQKPDAKPGKKLTSTEQAVSSIKIKSQTTNVAAEKKTISKKYIDAAWIIQVASFSKKDNAVNMVDKLKKSKYKAYRRRVLADNKTVYRIFVGPYIKKKDAEKAISKVNKISQGKSIIKPFDPIKH